MSLEREPYEPQEFEPKNLAKNKSRLSRRQQFILGTAGAAVGSTIIAGLAQACESNNPETIPTTNPEATLTIPTPPKPEFTTTLPDGSTATIEIPTITPYPTSEATPTPTETPPPTPEVTPTPEQKLLENLASKINTSNFSEQEKTEYLQQIEELKKIERAQSELLNYYLKNLGPDNKTPALLYYTELKLPSLPGITPESQIFILQNQRILDNVIEPQLKSLSENFNTETAKSVFEQIKFNSNHISNPEGPYFGLNITLSDYSELNTSIENQSDIAYEGLSQEEINSLKTIEQQLAPLIGKFTLIKAGNLEPNFFQDLGDEFELHINPSNIQSLRHEWAHATNIAQNNQIPLSLSAEQLVQLTTLYEKALADPLYGRQYATLEQLFTAYSEMNPYVAGASSYPFETLVTNTEINSQEKIFKIEPHNFATNSQTGEKLSVEEVVKIFDLQNRQYKNSAEFVSAKLPQLEKLAQTSDFYRVFVEMLKKNPETMDNLASKVSKNSIANRNFQSESNYLRFFVEYYCDSAFTVGLISDHPEIKTLYLSLSGQDQKLLLANTLAITQHADFETWSEGSRFSVESPNPQPNDLDPFAEYYTQLRLAIEKN